MVYKTNIMPAYVPVKFMQAYLGGRGRGYAYRVLNSGQVASIKDGGRRLVNFESLVAYAERLKTTGSTPSN